MGRLTRWLLGGTALVAVVAAAREWGDPVSRWAALDRSRARGDNPPPWALDPEKWERAREAVEPHWQRYEELEAAGVSKGPWAVVTHVYKQMGGRIA